MTEAPLDVGKPLRLVTWNLNHWRQPLLPADTRRAALEYLTHTIGAHRWLRLLAMDRVR